MKQTLFSPFPFILFFQFRHYDFPATFAPLHNSCNTFPLTQVKLSRLFNLLFLQYHRTACIYCLLCDSPVSFALTQESHLCTTKQLCMFFGLLDTEIWFNFAPTVLNIPSISPPLHLWYFPLHTHSCPYESSCTEPHIWENIHQYYKYYKCFPEFKMRGRFRALSDL